MQIAFISANREKMPDAVIPLGLLHVMAATPARHEKLFWDLCFEADPIAAVVRNLREHTPLRCRTHRTQTSMSCLCAVA